MPEEVNSTEGQGQEVQSSGEQEQSVETQHTETPSGQDLIAPYLESVDEKVRPVVSEVLENYRKEQDANFNRALEQRAQELQALQQEAEIPMSIYQNLMTDPVGTLEWLTDRLNEEMGVNAREQLLTKWQQATEQNTESQTQEGEQKPLTAEEVERILEEREQARVQQEQQAQRQREQTEQAQKQVNNWITEAAKNHRLTLQENDPLLPVIIQQAASLQDAERANGRTLGGQQAIEMTVESISKRFGTSQTTEEGGSGPRLAEGGTPPPAKDIDVSDSKQRQARMLEMLQSSQP